VRTSPPLGQLRKGHTEAKRCTPFFLPATLTARGCQGIKGGICFPYPLFTKHMEDVFSEIRILRYSPKLVEGVISEVCRRGVAPWLPKPSRIARLIQR
jgi:hypothetical protein